MRRTNGIRSSACQAARQPGGSAGVKTTLSSGSGGGRWQDYPSPGCQEVGGLSDFFCSSKDQLVPRTTHYGRKLHAAYMQGLRNITWKRCLEFFYLRYI